jgi:nitrate/nitrite transporter NarK
VGVAWNLNDCSKRRVGESPFASCRLCFWALLVLGGGVFFLLSCFLVHPYDGSQPRPAFGMINSIGHIGGFIGTYAVGQLNDRTGSLSAAFLRIAVCSRLAGKVIALIRLPLRVSSTPANLSPQQDLAAS